MSGHIFAAGTGGGAATVDLTGGNLILVVIVGVIALVALVMAVVFRGQVLAAGEGTENMRTIARAVQEGANAYLTRQFRTLAIFAAIAFFALLALPADDTTVRIFRSVFFLVGAGFSATVGYLGMNLAVRANLRVAAAANAEGREPAMRIGLRTGAMVGMLTVGLGLLGASIVVLAFQDQAPKVLEGFGFGAALLAMFMRVGGGIFTKAADVGADLVGKVEQGIPEDDPRNAATIADNVGDNVGDCAGMAADLFESSEITLIASLILGAAAFAGSPKGAIIGVMFPLFVRAVGVVTSMIGIVAVAPRSEEEHGMRAINRGFFVSAAVSAAAAFVISGIYMDTYKPAIAVLIGLVLASAIQKMTQYFTDTKFKPVQEIAAATVTGPATTILSGFSIGLESTVWSALVIGAAMIGSYFLGDTTRESLYFISLTGMGMLTTVGVIVSMDTYGPISDNAQGIAEMSGEFEGRPAEILGGLDAIGNSTKAITKGIAIATAVIAATSLFGSFAEAVLKADASLAINGEFPIRVDQPNVLVGLLIGGCVAFLFSSLAIRAVGRAASQVVVEVRNQFRDHPGIMDYTEKPDYGAVVDICTRTSLRELMTPGLLALLAPIIAGFFLEAEALGAFLAGAILTGQLLAVMLSNSGGAWDNAKKLIEEGNYGGKGSESHKAAVIGDTVGDPFKDTAGPALNPLIKVMNLVALLIAPVIVTHADDTALRAGVCIVGAVVLGAMIWVSKSRESGLEEDVERAKAGTTAA